ncbi:hypothetical protein AB9M62_25380 [Bacillales bacterium AN1005]
MKKRLSVLFLLLSIALVGCSNQDSATATYDEITEDSTEGTVPEDTELTPDLFKVNLKTAKYNKDDNSMYVEFETGLPDGTEVLLKQYMPSVDMKYDRILTDLPVLDVPVEVKDNKIIHTFTNDDVNETKFISAKYYFGVNIETNYEVNSFIYNQIGSESEFEKNFPEFKDSVSEDDETRGYTILYDDFKTNIDNAYSLDDLIGEYKNEIPYKELEKNPDGFYNDKTMIKGEVLQIQEEDVDYEENGYSKQTVIRVNVSDDPNEVVYVEYNSIIGTDAVRGDTITVYGTITGSVTYESVAGYDITIPSMEAIVIE